MNYEEGTLLWYWFENWILVGGFAVTLVVTVLVAGRSSWGLRGLLLKAVMVAAVLVVLPLTLTRMGINIATLSDLTAGYLSLAGVLGSLVVGIPYLVAVRRITEAKWEHRVAPLYRTAAWDCDHFRSNMVQGFLPEPQTTAIAVVLEELPRILKAIRANPEPKSARAREAGRNFERGLRGYISGAKLADQLFKQSQEGFADRVIWERASQDARDTIAAHISSEILPATEDMAKAIAYFKPRNR